MLSAAEFTVRRSAKSGSEQGVSARLIACFGRRPRRRPKTKLRTAQGGKEPCLPVKVMEIYKVQQKRRVRAVDDEELCLLTRQGNGT